MMALAPIVITTSVLTIILQIVLIILVLDTKKRPNLNPRKNPYWLLKFETQGNRESMKTDLTTEDPSWSKDKTIPGGRRPDSECRPRGTMLRDINLRLKNAERDQEKNGGESRTLSQLLSIKGMILTNQGTEMNSLKEMIGRVRIMPSNVLCLFERKTIYWNKRN